MSILTKPFLSALLILRARGARTHTHTHTHTHTKLWASAIMFRGWPSRGSHSVPDWWWPRGPKQLSKVGVLTQWRMSLFDTPGSCSQVNCTAFRVPGNRQDTLGNFGRGSLTRLALEFGTFHTLPARRDVMTIFLDFWHLFLAFFLVWHHWNLAWSKPGESPFYTCLNDHWAVFGCGDRTRQSRRFRRSQRRVFRGSYQPVFNSSSRKLIVLL